MSKSEIRRLENVFEDLTRQANIASSENKDLTDIEKQRSIVLDMLTRLRREEYEDRFRLNMDEDDYR